MSRCEYCQRSGTSVWISTEGEVERPNHDKFCPNHHILQALPVLPSEILDVFLGKTDRARSVDLWNKGWEEGRQRIGPNFDHRTYMLGWLTGECALEEAENGCSFGEEE